MDVCCKPTSRRVAKSSETMSLVPLRTRRLIVASGRSISVSPELFALYSPNFCSVFFDDVEESDVIRLDGVTLTEIRKLTTLFSQFNKVKGYPNREWPHLMSMVGLCARFRVCSPLLDAALKQKMEFSLEDIHLQTIPFVLQVIRVYERRADKSQALDTFLNRFAFARCLTTFHSRYREHFTPKQTERIQQRILYLRARSRKRPKILIQYAKGDVEVSVPVEMYPRLQRMLDKFRRQEVKWPTFTKQCRRQANDVRRDYPTPFVFETPVMYCAEKDEKTGIFDREEVLGEIVKGADVVRCPQKLKGYEVIGKSSRR